MLSYFCVSKPKKNKKIPLENLINYVCHTTKPWIVADVIGSCVDFIEHQGWHFKYKSEFNKDYKLDLVLDIKYSIHELLNESEEKEDCVVCTEETCESIICCNQPICKKCLKEIQIHNPDNFSCPMCRKNLNTYTVTYRFTKEEVKTKSALYNSK